MNQTKHPKFIKALTSPALRDRSCPVSQALHETLLNAGYDTREPLHTMDGDRVRIIAIDAAHQYPVVGEVIDFGAETSWLGRWSGAGVYASSERDAVRKHSLERNCDPGQRYADPAEDEACGAGHAPPLNLTPDEVTERAADFSRRTDTGPTTSREVYKASLAQSVLSSRAATQSGEVFRPQPQVDRAGGSGGRVRPDAEQEYDAAFAEACRRTDERVTREPFAGLKLNPNGAPAKLDTANVCLGKAPMSVSAQLVWNAKEIVGAWSSRHRHDRSLRVETAKHLGDLSALERFYYLACIEGRISHEAHAWCLAGLYAIAGRLRVDGSPWALLPEVLEEALHGVRKLPSDVTYVVYVTRGVQAA